MSIFLTHRRIKAMMATENPSISDGALQEDPAEKGYEAALTK